MLIAISGYSITYMVNIIPTKRWLPGIKPKSSPWSGVDFPRLKPAYHFGFGLSYTIFAYSDLQVEKQGDRLEVTVKVSNTGERVGEEVVQVYIGMENSQVERQNKLLKGFEKVSIPAGKIVDVTITISLDELRYYDEQEKRWILEEGSYQVLVGPNSDEGELLKAKIIIEST